MNKNISQSMNDHCKIVTLSNGLRVVMESLPFVRSISFGIWVRNGSRNETAKTNGISHFIEHMMFKGTDKRTAMDIADTMDAVGGQLNAFTAKEYTCYFARTLDTHFDVALDVLSDMFFNSKYDQAEINKERNVILEELSMYEDTPEDLCADLLQEKIFPQHSLGMGILGTPDTINAFQREDFMAFLKAKYRPENVVVSVAGNINEDEVLSKIANVFEHFKSEGELETSPIAVYKPGFAFKEKDIEQVHLSMSFPGIRSGVDESYALAAVNTIFGGGMSSRLFQKIREEHGLVYSVYSYNASYIDTGAFIVSAALSPDNVYEVLKLISQEVRGMFAQRITEEQLGKAKEQLKSSFLLSLESASSRMNSIGRSLLMLNRIVTPDELVAKIDAVNMDAFYRVCDTIFKMDQMSISLVGKVDGMNADAVSGAVLD